MESIDISFNYGKHLEESLVRLWKLTRNDLIRSKFASVERLNNRSWRILSRKVLKKTSKEQSSEVDAQKPLHDSITDLSKDSLSDLAPKQSQFLSDRPSLFSHSSNLSLHSNRKSTNNSSLESYNPKNNPIPDSEEDDDDYDISDISDISEEEEDEDEPVSPDQSSPHPEFVNNQLTDQTKAHSSHSSHKTPEQFSSQNGEIPRSPVTSSHLSQLARSRAASSAQAPPLGRSRTSFVRGFSPSQVSISPASSLTSKRQGSTVSKSSLTHEEPLQPHPQPPQSLFNQSASERNSNRGSQAVSSRASLSTQSGQTGDTNQPPIKRHNSLFNNFQIQFKKDEPSTTHSSITQSLREPDSESKDDGYSSTDISEDEDDYSDDEIVAIQPKEAPDEFVLKRDRKSSNATQMTTDNDSEWLSVSSEDDDLKSEEPKFHPLQFNKIPTMTKNISNSSTSTDILPVELNDSQKHRKRNSSPAITTKPRSLLSGLFLNELAAQNQQNSHISPKPVLKRSSTTGVITFDQFKNGNRLGSVTELASNSKRPYIMFTKKYPSSTDISKNYPHFHNNSVKKDIVQEDLKSNDDDDDSVMGKQKSIVGISDFNATASSSTSMVNEDMESSGSIHHTSPEPVSSHAILSSSLKMSGSMTNNSIRSLLSKSSLNITKLYNNSKSMFGRYDGRDERNGEESKEEDKPSEPKVSIPVPAEKFDSPKLGSPHSMSTPITATPAKSLNDDLSLFKEGNQETADNINGIKLSPKSTRRSMLSTELSNSLKESIIIDYKLGKIPLPKKVFGPNYEGMPDIGEVDANDYHSKGW
ncbi:uncharacterized protein CANTADRAFT_258963 [Suhomyces tanzawaensis NRRL Y-17324]|uniref:Nitrogen regulatory protein areA GATA-like domain-containing protein n=1 Tax=Suhomyces tanzawaensis NRRL Y-17324 TaxID=984487 RepID=A0A1E4SIW5_9ASCO|nr:uncharacterized protein CANTADRAFT_258963 [Suhomyces tanzawaensis NRRL Y-17324]ODV79438.1 hypothetical protein CANTADRAFT_258963 [Suhomyces tanzawaensis NRRL Y-17324]